MRRWVTNIAITVGLAAASMPVAADEHREQSSRDWDARGIERVSIDNPRGEISVRPSPDGRVHLTAQKVVHHSDQHGADVLARETRLVADLHPGGLDLSVQYPQRQIISLNLWDVFKGIEIPEIEVLVAIEVPASMSILLRSASGDLQTTGLTGPQDLKSASGDIQVDDAPGALAVRTSSGDATFGDIGSASIGSASGNIVIDSARGPVDVRTQSGDVRINAASDSLLVSTASGEVRVGLARDGLDVRTASGDVTARGGGHVRIRTESGESKVALIAPLHHAEFSSASGDVNVRVASGIDCDIDADAGSGDVDVELPLDVRSMKGNHVTGRLGRGTAGIVIRSSSGSVDVAR